MRIINSRYFKAAKLQPYQSFFVEVWQSMTHSKSLDTYRVRCMNARTILRELSEEMRIGLVDDCELYMLCSETKAILEEDVICSKHFPNYLQNILPFLSEIPERTPKEKGKRQENKSRLNNFCFILSDFVVALERSYLIHLCNELKLSIKTNNEYEIRMIVSSLLSDLADRGWPLESLSSWPQNYLKVPATHTFDENLEFMLKILQNPRQEFEVILKVAKCSSLPTIGQHGDFSFSSLSGIAHTGNPNIDKFATSYQSVCFAKTRVVDFDHRSAAVNARENLEIVIDELRFGFEPDKLSIDNLSYVERLSDNKKEIILIPYVIPNPTDDIPYSNFISFSDNLNIILKKTAIEQTSRRQLQAAIRQYRFGRDIDNFQDKFLYWWMGLEALARNESGSIGPVVVNNVSYCMSMMYLRQILDDFLHTLQYCKINWPKELAEVSGVNKIDELNSEQLLKVIHSKHRQILLKSCDEHTTVSFYGDIIIETLADPKKTAQYIQTHLHHLKWHLSRLWRIRCTIVHGSESIFRLRLFTANLEYYLRQMIIASMKIFSEYDHITSLQEIFLRASIAYENSIEALEAPAANQDTIRKVISYGGLLAVPQ